MPNWCYTNIKIYHKDKEKLDDLLKKIYKWEITPALPNVNWDHWLGNIVLNAEIGTVDEGKPTDLRCRGSLVYAEVEDGYLIVETETAWVPFMTMWQKLVDKYLPDAEISYWAEECGCGVFWTNNPDYAKEYRIDSGGEVIDKLGDSIFDDFSYDGAVKLLQEILETDESDLDRLTEEINEGDYSISVEPWQYVPLSECE